MIVTWSAAVAAGAFVILVAGLLVGMRILLGRLAQVQQSAEAMQREVARLGEELRGLVPPAEETIRTANRQLTNVNRLFEAAGEVGGAIKHTTSAVQSVTAVLADSAARHAERAATKRQVGEAFEWAELGIAAWQLWQSKRSTAASASADEAGHHAHVTAAFSESTGRDEGHAKNERSES
ncbi:DUF948 domain-containing protein [Paenibacillus sp. 2TAB19]|uniref:DUF948 domain-containing protein n=1 Tax=Paenibacillus sp. 2TAB19 TaxID=3233003 RepID=UPI003F94C423